MWFSSTNFTSWILLDQVGLQLVSTTGTRVSSGSNQLQNVYLIWQLSGYHIIYFHTYLYFIIYFNNIFYNERCGGVLLVLMVHWLSRVVIVLLILETHTSLPNLKISKRLKYIEWYYIQEYMLMNNTFQWNECVIYAILKLEVATMTIILNGATSITTSSIVKWYGGIVAHRDWENQRWKHYGLPKP